MNTQEWDRVKKTLRVMQSTLEEHWLEKMLLRNLIIDSGWMDEASIESALARGKNQPSNQQAIREMFGPADEYLALLGFADWNAQFESRNPDSDPSDE